MDEDRYHGCRRLAGRRALVTGASTGIGRAIAVRFAAEGASVAINYGRSLTLFPYFRTNRST